MTRVGIDIGGTRTRIGAVSDSGEILQRFSTATQPERGPEPLIHWLSDAIRELRAHTPGDPSPLCIGIGVTGPVDIRTGIVTNPDTLPGWPATNLTTPLSIAFPDAAIAIDNDANTAALGEWRIGAGRGVRRFAMITLGTGIGAGFLIDGVIQRSSTERHGEAGHQLLDPSGPQCYCGARGCWEVLASGSALSRRLAGRTVTPSNPETIEVLNDIARWVGLGLVNVCALFAPDVIAIGGGVSLHFNLMRETIARCLHEHQRFVPTDITIEAAQTGDDAGMIGAAFLPVLAA
jgi:glucokinase